MWKAIEKSFTLRFTLLGVAFGACFPLFSLAFENFFLRQHPVAISQLVVENLIQGIVMLAPIILGCVFYFIGKGQSALRMQLAHNEVIKNQLYKNANSDHLTDIGNRAALLCTLQNIQSECSRQFSCCCVYLLDLDKFKFVNDTMGHQIGDKLLVEVANRLRAQFGSNGLIFRLGGDEFVVLEPSDPNPMQMPNTAEAIIALFSKPFNIDGRKIMSGCSVGCSKMDSGDDNKTDVLGRADLALYEAKRNAENSFSIYDQSMADKAHFRMMMEQNISQGLRRDEFNVVFQPIINIASNQITGFEALLRWKHPKFGSVPPAKFIPIAEFGGLIIQLGDFVLRRSCEEAAKWPDATTISVNISIEQFKHKLFYNQVVDALKNAGLSPDRLILEITENVAIADIGIIDQSIEKLRALGIRFALDDFGTGFSSISHLRFLKLDYLKLDRSFSKAILNDPNEIELVKILKNISDHFNLITTIEGVETAEQLELMQKIGIELAQGFYLDKPLSAEQAMERLQQNNQLTPLSQNAV